MSGVEQLTFPGVTLMCVECSEPLDAGVNSIKSVSQGSPPMFSGWWGRKKLMVVGWVLL